MRCIKIVNAQWAKVVCRYKNVMKKLYKTNYNFNISEFGGFVIRIFC